MPIVKRFAQGECPIETAVDGATVKGYFTFVSQRDFNVVLEENPNYQGGTHIPLLGGPFPYLFCDENGNPTEKCIERAKNLLLSFHQKHLFVTNHKSDIQELISNHEAENAERKAADEEILKTPTKSLYKKLQAGEITKEEHFAALKKRREAKDDLREIERERYEKVNELAKSCYPSCDGFYTWDDRLF